MKCGGYRECAAGTHGPEGVPLDRNFGEQTICMEGWNGKVAGIEEFSKSSGEIIQHAGRLRHVVPERVEDEPVLWAVINHYAMACAVMPWPTASGDGCVDVITW